MICFKSTFDAEVKFISMTLFTNGFPLNVVQRVITHKITEFRIKQAPVQSLGGISKFHKLYRVTIFQLI